MDDATPARIDTNFTTWLIAVIARSLAFHQFRISAKSATPITVMLAATSTPRITAPSGLRPFLLVPRRMVRRNESSPRSLRGAKVCWPAACFSMSIPPSHCDAKSRLVMVKPMTKRLRLCDGWVPHQTSCSESLVTESCSTLRIAQRAKTICVLASPTSTVSTSSLMRTIVP